MTSTLPPKVIGEIEGRLDILVLRPVLIPTLQSSQVLEFFIKWWGDDNHSVAKLLPNSDEAKFVFNICCDIERFQKYLNDAEELALEVFVSDGIKSDKLNSPARYLHKNKKEWINGEYIGRFQMRDIKLNSRGEFVYEGKIVNKYRDICGSLVVFMLYTPKYNLGLNTESLFSSSDAEHKKMTSCDLTNQTQDLSLNSHSAFENLSIQNDYSNSSVMNNLPSHIDEGNFIENCENKSQLSYISDTDLLEYLPDKSFLITRLFSFVDSGAIQLSDVPTLLQICQERSSHQLNLGSFQSGRKLSPKLIGSSNVSFKTKTDDDGKKNKLKAGDSRAISLSNISTRPVFKKSLEKPSHVEDFAKDHSHMNLSPKLLNNSNVYLNTICDSNETTEKLTSDASLLIIYVTTINLNPFEKREISMEAKPTSSKQSNFKKKNAVRQRSKICYFLQISLFCDKSSENPKSALIVSRQIENGVVIYNAKEILPLPNNNISEELKGHLKVRVIRRKLGERLGTEIGIGLVALKNLYVIRDKKAHLKLWLPNKESGNESHQTIGKLEFSVAFALLSDVYPSLDCDNCDENVVFHDSLSKDNSYICSKYKDDSLVANQLRHSSNYADMGYPLQQFNANNNYSANECCEDSKIYPFKENKLEKDIDLSCCAPNINPHIEDAVVKNYKKSRRKLFDKKQLNHSDASCSPIDCYKVTPEDFNSSTTHNLLKSDFSQMQREECLSKSPSAQDFNYDRSIIYADVSSCLEHSLHNEINCEVLLEIREGRNFPMLLSNRSDRSFAPNAYVKVCLKSAEFETCVLKKSVSPKWNFRTVLKINKEDLNQTEDHFLLLVFHSRNGVSSGADDPVLGFVALDIHLLWTSAISLSGWVPVLNKDQSICGEINLTLTSLKSMLSDCGEVTEEAMTPSINSPQKSSADSKESSTQTSQVWGISLYGQHALSDYRKHNLSTVGDGVSKITKHCNVSSIKDSKKENITSFGPEFSKGIYDSNMTSNKAVFQPQVNEPVSPVGDETFIISRRNILVDFDELKNLQITDNQVGLDVGYDVICGESDELRSSSQTETVKSYDTAREKCELKHFTLLKSPKSNIESFTWMNQLETLDTPCASYIDSRPYNDSVHYTLLKDKGSDILPTINEKVPFKKKRIKCRIAANINMPKYA